MGAKSQSVGGLLRKLLSQSWFLLFVLGAGCSLSLADVYFLFAGSSALSLSTFGFYCGEAVAPLLMCLYWYRFGGGQGVDRRLFAEGAAGGRAIARLRGDAVSDGAADGPISHLPFSRHPALFAVPVTSIALGVILAVAGSGFGATNAGLISFAAAALVGAGTMCIPFVWIEPLMVLDKGTSSFVFAAALVVSGFVQLTLALCRTGYSVILLLAMLVFTVIIYEILRHVVNREAFEEISGELCGNGRVRKMSVVSMIPMIFLLAFAQFAKLSDVPAMLSISSDMSSQVFSFVGVILAGFIGMWLSVHAVSDDDNSAKMLCLSALILVALFLLGFLQDGQNWTVLPLYAAKKLLFLLVFINAFSADKMFDRARSFSLSMLLIVVAWFAGDALRSLAAHFGMPVEGALSVAAMLAVVAMVVWTALVLAGEKTSFQEDAQVADAECGLANGNADEVAIADDQVLLRYDSQSNRFGLTVREREVFRYLALGLSSEYIADRLTVSPATVRTHAHNIYAKAGVSSQHELVEMLFDADR